MLPFTLIGSFFFQGHLLYGYAIVILTNQIHSIFWTMPHCVLVLKLIG